MEWEADVQDYSSQTLNSNGFNRPLCFYRDFFLLRVPISINGRPSVIKLVNGDPILRLPDGGYVSVKLQTIAQQAVGYVLSKHGVCHLNAVYSQSEHVSQHSVTFQSKTHLKNFLTNKENLQKELASAVINACVHESNNHPASFQIPSMKEIAISIDVFLVSPNANGKGSPEIHPVSLSNYPSIAQTWQNSKLFEYGKDLLTDEDTHKHYGEPIKLGDI